MDDDVLNGMHVRCCLPCSHKMMSTRHTLTTAQARCLFIRLLFDVAAYERSRLLSFAPKQPQAWMSTTAELHRVHLRWLYFLRIAHVLCPLECAMLMRDVPLARVGHELHDDGSIPHTKQMEHPTWHHAWLPITHHHQHSVSTARPRPYARHHVMHHTLHCITISSSTSHPQHEM